MCPYPRSASSAHPDNYWHVVIGYASMMAENRDIDWTVDSPFLLGAVDMGILLVYSSTSVYD